MTNLRVAPQAAIDGFRASPVSYYGTAAVGGAAGGPAGSTSMTFFCVVYPKKLAAGVSQVLFNRGNIGGNGWNIYQSGSAVLAIVYRTAGTFASVSTGGLVNGNWDGLSGLFQPHILLASYQQVGGNSTLDMWINDRQPAQSVIAGLGFNPYAGPTTIGVVSNANLYNATDIAVGDCGFLDGYNPTTFVSTTFGNGAPGLIKSWQEDFRQGRYLTWPRAAVANSDWHWAAKDVVVGPTVRPTWTDRYSATAMLRFGSPQGASFPALL